MAPVNLYPDLASRVPTTLLVVDDDEMNRCILGNIFASHYSIQEAANGKEGLEMILAGPEKLCAVLLDVMMPEMDGIQVLRHLKEADVLRRLPVFLITAEASGSVMKEAYELGVVDVISKPVIPYVVLRRVQSVIELYQARRRLSHVVEIQQSELLEKAQKIVDLNMGMIEALSAAIEFRNGESGEHVHRIHDITEFLLTNTPLGDGLTPDEIGQISLAAIMHDVGKIAIPDAILNKPGKLTPEEFEIMKTHTVQGAQLLEKIPPAAGKRGVPLRLRHRPPPPRALGRPGLPRRAQGGRDLHLGSGGVPGGRIRCPELQAGIQRRLPPSAGAGHDPGGAVRRI